MRGWSRCLAVGLVAACSEPPPPVGSSAGSSGAPGITSAALTTGPAPTTAVDPTGDDPTTAADDDTSTGTGPGVAAPPVAVMVLGVGGVGEASVLAVPLCSSPGLVDTTLGSIAPDVAVLGQLLPLERVQDVEIEAAAG